MQTLYIIIIILQISLINVLNTFWPVHLQNRLLPEAVVLLFITFIISIVCALIIDFDVKRNLCNKNRISLIN
jgi:hypothetical protein